jgi:predicted CXXCH cytochrome family protein
MREEKRERLETRIKAASWFVLILLFVFGGFAGCKTLRSSKPIIPIAEYEKMLVGRLDANYVGTKNCLSACHYHDQVNLDFEASTMGAQMSEETNLPLVDCESCHGPGSLAIEGLTPEKVEADAKAGIQTPCDFKTLIDLKNLPAQAQSLLCLKCHTANATFNLHEWNAGAHAMADVSCFPCHDVHAGPDLITTPKDTKGICLECHREQEAEFLLPSCHGEVEGPYTFGHANLMYEDCTVCHADHGSVNNNLLILSEPYLCLQCHAGHPTSSNPATGETKAAFYTRCTDCHSQVHGTDIPSASGTGRFTQ